MMLTLLGAYILYLSTQWTLLSVERWSTGSSLTAGYFASANVILIVSNVV